MKFFLRIIPKLLIILFFSNSALSSESDFEKVLSDNFKLITKSSSKTVEPVIEKLLNSNFSKVEEFLKFWKSKKLIFTKKTKIIATLKQKNELGYELIQFSNNKNLGFFKKKEFKSIKPNSGVRSKISNALIGFQLQNKDVKIRSKSLETLARKFNPKYLNPLKNAIEKETAPIIKKRMSELLVFGTIKYSTSVKDKIASLNTLRGNLSIEARGVISSLLRSKVYVGDVKTNFVSEEVYIKELDYFYSNSISRSSKTMSECRQIKQNLKKTGTSNI